jgi:integrase
MMSMEAIKALRLRNLSGMLVDHNIVENQLDAYELRYEPHETKTWARIRAPLPDKLAPWIKYWLEVVRLNLLRISGQECQTMWVTTKGADMKPITLYYRFCQATKEETGKRINPHLCRKIIATGIAIGAPEMIELAPGALDHTSRRHTQDAYDLADDLAASRAVNSIVGRRRQEAIQRSKR